MHSSVRQEVPDDKAGKDDMGALRKRKLTQISADYDRDADVLYIAKGPIVPGYGDEGVDDLIFRYSLEDGSPIGVTIEGYSALQWDHRSELLAGIVAGHFGASPGDVVKALAEAGL